MIEFRLVESEGRELVQSLVVILVVSKGTERVESLIEMLVKSEDTECVESLVVMLEDSPESLGSYIVRYWSGREQKCFYLTCWLSCR